VLQRPVESAQYTSWAFTDRAKRSGLVPSKGSIGDCYDNAMIESFWGRKQTELLNRKHWKTVNGQVKVPAGGRIEVPTPCGDF
jgi:transposase InsO family protein